jgi:hypothetical protein
VNGGSRLATPPSYDFENGVRHFLSLAFGNDFSVMLVADEHEPRYGPARHHAARSFSTDEADSETARRMGSAHRLLRPLLAAPGACFVGGKASEFGDGDRRCADLGRNEGVKIMPPGLAGRACERAGRSNALGRDERNAFIPSTSAVITMSARTSECELRAIGRVTDEELSGEVLTKSGHGFSSLSTRSGHPLK